MAENNDTTLYDNLPDSPPTNPPDYITQKILGDMFEHFCYLDQKVNIVNNGYDMGRKKIEDECKRISNEIDDAAKYLIQEILDKRDIMLNDVENYKNEALIDYKERYENNEKFEKNKNTINIAYKMIREDLSRINPNNKEQCRSLKEQIELLSTKINDANAWLMPDPNPSIGIMFEKNEQIIKLPFIGDVTYDSINKVDMITKILYLNNSAQQRFIKLDHLVEQHLIAKFIGIISKNKILLIYEKVYGKVISVFAKVVYYNGTVIYETEICNVGNIVHYGVYDKYILLDFRHSRNNHIIHLYDTHLKLLESHNINYDIESILMNNQSIFLMSEKKPFVNEFDYKLNYKASFGQKSKETKPFYVKDEIVSITDLKIFVQCDNEIRLLDRASGEVLSSFKMDDLKTSKIYLDFNKEKYIVFNGHDRVTYYNHKGEVLTTNKLRIREVFDDFQFSRSGHFAFVNNRKNFVLVI